MISIKNLTKNYATTNVFENLSVDFEQGKITCILGESGSGKTTLLNVLAGLTPYTGQVDNVKCSYVFQKPNLFPNMTVNKNLLIVCNDQEAVDNIASEFSIQDKLSAYPSRLSGGQAQRVALARGLLYNANLLLLDEPFSSLDFGLKYDLLSKVKAYHEKSKNTVIAVTHDIKEAVYLADRILILSNGKIVYDNSNVNEKTESEIFGLLTKGNI